MAELTAEVGEWTQRITGAPEDVMQAIEFAACASASRLTLDGWPYPFAVYYSQLLALIVFTALAEESEHIAPGNGASDIIEWCSGYAGLLFPNRDSDA